MSVPKLIQDIRDLKNKISALSNNLLHITSTPDENVKIWIDPDEDDQTESFYTKAETDRLLQKKVNPNLLDNWYFGNPVNQRGHTSYRGSGYGIDRWKATNSNTTVVISYGCIHLSGTDAVPYIINTLEFPSLVLGKVVTLSVLLDDGTLKSAKSTLPSSLPSANTLYCNITDVADLLGTSSYLSVRLKAKSGNSNNIVAVKLELGDQQTLAHQDDNGNWVLNEIPNYAEELAKCQRYFVNFNLGKAKWFSMPVALATATSFAQSPIILPVSMRTTPTLSYGGNLVIAGVTGSTGVSDDIPITSIRINDSTFGGTSIQLQYYASGLTNGAAYRVQGGEDSDSYICLSADL